MPGTPRFKCFLSHEYQAVPEGGRIWTTPIPLSRQQVDVPFRKETSVSVSHGVYFSAVREFLEKDRFKMLVLALSKRLDRNVTLEELSEIRIFLEKHGEFYHPARIEAELNGLTIPFVVNVALSDTGKNGIRKEYRLLQRLHTDFSFSFLPRVYGQDRILSKGGDFETRMFLGEWFEAYSEFHISRDPADGKLKIVVWHSEHDNYFLTVAQTMELYRQAAMILTCYYNIETFEHISSWHHAAGDFVVKCQNGKIDVKLVTVRQYGPMFADDGGVEPKAPDAMMMLEALLVFFLNLAIRMRLDRLDGVGQIVWSDTIAVGETLRGFLDGLALKPPGRPFAAPLADCFWQQLLSCTHTELLDLNRAIVQKFHPRSPDVPVVQQHLQQHVDDLYDAVQQQRAHL
ncbi:MAG: hypothetical protein ABIK98_04575 [Pseudomonadota bacterium]